MTQQQVEGVDALLNDSAEFSVNDPRHIANILATPVIETGNTFQPIVENLNYSEQGLRNTFPKYVSPADAKAYARQPQKIVLSIIWRHSSGNPNSTRGSSKPSPVWCSAHRRKRT
ncbi:hypothetical protein [Aliirhizobium smilacinae]|uniref:hypothetical protein n=1 Tax=Aliirhizobium smilacinae TaxID=1395944 RepID=UPI001FE38918|nr:hypothetical protein [Rhizobium smilacinae]